MVFDFSEAELAYRLAQARTGTGKTLAFLIPVLQNIINYDPSLEKRSGVRSGQSTDIRAIIISPTRELAEQIAVEAKKVTRDTGVIVQTAVGGSQKSFHLQKMKREGCHVLVGTPGRLNDILSDPNSQVRAPNLSAFVLDEADRLLDQGFAPDIKDIQGLLPARETVDRQTLLYSATVPREVMAIVRATMKRDFEFVRTVQQGEVQTHEKVPQKSVNVGGFENLVPALVELCQREINNSTASGSSARPFKAIVYFSATADATLTSFILNNLRNPGQSMFSQHPLHPAEIFEIHARLNQQRRTRAADSFRRAKSAILLSSDVTARGMDFPNVTHVIQVGVPPTEEQYVHRIGRTARAGQTGEGWILYTNIESREIRHRLPTMPLLHDTSLETGKINMRKDAQLPEHTAKLLNQVGEAVQRAPRLLKIQSYMAKMGLYSWVHDRQAFVDALNNLSKYGWGMPEPPKVGSSLVHKLGLRNTQGLNIGSEERSSERSGERGGYGRERPSFGGSRRDFASERGGFGSDRGGGFRRPAFGDDRPDRRGFDSDRGGGFGRPAFGDDRNDTRRRFDRSRSVFRGDGRAERNERSGYGRSSYGAGRAERNERSGYGRSSYGAGDRGGRYGSGRRTANSYDR